MLLIVGLGNPGLKYRFTRHNAGFIAIDALAESMGVKFNKHRFSGVTAEGKLGVKKVMLLKPHTFMNLSGNSVREAMDYYKIPAGDVIVLYDDTDLEFAHLRIREKGSAGSHNGMKSVVSSVGSEDFPRVRIGIGRPPAQMELKDFVLQKLVKEKKSAFVKCCEDAAKATEILVKCGIAEAQQRYN